MSKANRTVCNRGISLSSGVQGFEANLGNIPRLHKNKKGGGRRVTVMEDNGIYYYAALLVKLPNSTVRNFKWVSAGRRKRK